MNKIKISELITYRTVKIYFVLEDLFFEARTCNYVKLMLLKVSKICVMLF